MSETNGIDVLRTKIDSLTGKQKELQEDLREMRDIVIMAGRFSDYISANGSDMNKLEARIEKTEDKLEKLMLAQTRTQVIVGAIVFISNLASIIIITEMVKRIISK